MIESAFAQINQAVAENSSPMGVSLITYAWVLILSSAGGIVNFYAKVKRGDARPFNFVELTGEVFTSAFVGLLTFWLCQWAKVDAYLSACFIGICGHMGSRALFWAEKAFAAYVEKRTGVKFPCGETPQHAIANSSKRKKARTR